MMTPESLLAGPRGRGLCLAVAHRLHDPVWGGLFHASSHPSSPKLRATLIDTLREADASQLSAWRNETTFVSPIAESIGHAQFWQEPDEGDVVAADPAVMTALSPIAAAICSSPAAQWWTSPVDLEQLRYTDRFDPHSGEPARPPVLGQTREGLRAWRAEADSGTHSWWSTPTGAQLPWTTRPFGGLGAAELVWEEDTFDYPAARVWHLTAGAARVYEINSSRSWSALVERYPLEVTRSRREEWAQVTGLDGPWFIPDYAAASHDFDGIHLTVAGYLNTATRAIPLANKGHTLLGGWAPDVTWWLTDALTLVRPTPAQWQLDPEDKDEVHWNEAPNPA